MISKPNENSCCITKSFKQNQTLEVVDRMHLQEEKYQSSEQSHFHGSSPLTHSPLNSDNLCVQTKPIKDDILKEWRIRVCEWMYKVVDYYALERQTIVVGMSYLDRYTAQTSSFSKNGYQLAALASMYLAIKLYEPRKGKGMDFTQLCKGSFTQDDMIDMEKKLLFSLSWLVHPPTPQAFARSFLQLLPSSLTLFGKQKIFEVSNYLIELTVFLSGYKASTIACASFLIAIRNIPSHLLSLEEAEKFNLTLISYGCVESTEHITNVKNSLYGALQESFGTLSALQKRIDPKGVFYMESTLKRKLKCVTPEMKHVLTPEIKHRVALISRD